MPRPHRFDLPGIRQHVMNRGARRDGVFPDDGACRHFVDLLSELPERFGVRVHGYALVGNHYHLLLQSPTGGMAQAMQFLQSRYALWLNAHHGWDGPIWRGRYRSRVVEDDIYWRHLLAYLHLNPVNAGLAKSADAARWTSHPAYVQPEGQGFVYQAEMRALYGSVEAYRRYLDEVLGGSASMPAEFDEAHLWGRPSAEWEQRLHVVEPLSEDEAWRRLEAVSGRDRGALVDARRGRKPNTARWVTMWWLTYATTLGQAEVGRLLGATPATVSRSIRRVRERGADDSWGAWVDALSESLHESG